MAKVLLLLNAGKGSEFKGKSLSEIQVSDDIVENDENELTGESKIEETTPTDNFMVAKKHNCGKKEENMKPKNNANRKRWLPSEKKLVVTHFKNHIKNKIAPKKKEVLNFIAKHSNIFQDYDWVRIKTLVYNCYRKL